MRGPASSIAIIIAAFVGGAVSVPAAAQMVPGTLNCRYDSHLATYLTRYDADSLKLLDGGAVEICTSSYDGHHEARLFAAPVLRRDDVCVLMSVDLYLAPDANGRLVEGDPPKDWAAQRRTDWENPRAQMMQGAGGACPPPGDPRYVETTNMTEGTFAALFGMWTAVQSGPEALDKLLSAPAAPDSVLGEFRALLADAASRRRLRLVNIYLLPPRRLASLMSETDAGAFEIEVARDGNGGAWYVLRVDWTPQGFRIYDAELIFS